MLIIGQIKSSNDENRKLLPYGYDRLLGDDVGAVTTSKRVHINNDK
jgi:hypothetical protein